MAENSFRIYKGKWLLKDFTLVGGSAGAVEKGDMMKFTNTTPATVALGNDAADCLVGISAGNYANQATAQQVKIWVPAEPKAECIGQVLAGKIEIGDTDAGRTCELLSHAGAAVDTGGDKNLYIVKGIKAYTTDGAGTAKTCGTTAGHEGVAIFRIAQTPEKRDSWA